MKTFSRAQLARLTAVHVETLRFYERRGLLPDRRPTRAGFRTYCENDVKRVQIIRSAQRIGFTLKEIAELLSLLERSSTCCGHIQQVAVEKLREIEQQMDRLQRVSARLRGFARRCNPSTPIRDCRLVGFSIP